MAFTVRRASVLGLFALVGAALPAVGDAGKSPVRAEPRAPQPQPVVPADAPPPGSNVVRHGFPAASFDPDDPTKSETAWEVEWELTHPMNKPYLPPGSAL